MKLSLILFILQLFLGISSFAHKIDIHKLIGPYPLNGSIEEARDYEQLLAYQNTRTEAQCKQAKKEELITIGTFFAGKNGPLSRVEAFQLAPLFVMLQLRTFLYSRTAKNLYKRPRPYNANPKIQPCIKREKSYAYPSGHTTIARYAARVLSVIFPDRKKAIMARADEISNNRVLGGVHHPSDIVAGHKLGDALARKFIKDEQLF